MMIYLVITQVGGGTVINRACKKTEDADAHKKNLEEIYSKHEVKRLLGEWKIEIKQMELEE